LKPRLNPTTTVSVPHDIAQRARKRAAELQIAVDLYLRVLVRNAQRRPGSGAKAPQPASHVRYTSERLPLSMPRRERAAIVASLSRDDSLSAHVSRLIAEDTATPGQPFTILPK